MSDPQTTPIDRMIDAAVSCVKCGTPGVGTCDCWVKLECPSCRRWKWADRDNTDPPGTRRVRAVCDRCPKDAAVIDYFDAQGRQIDLEGRPIR